MLNKVKEALDITGTGRDQYLTDLIEAGIMDMRRVGVTSDVMGDPLASRCVQLYCRWQENYEEEGERYKSMYEHLRDSLSQSGDYNA